MARTAAIPLAGRLVPRSPKRVLALRSDDRLVELARAGDDIAFEVLYERHVAGVLGFCRHMLGSQAEAEDAVQQAFVSAHGAMRRGSREIAFKPWLYTIARNRCLSMLRARREQPSESLEISTAGLNEQVERSAELRELVADVQRLPEQQRAALVLSELGDLSHAEVAEVIGFEPQAIKGLVFRARAALAERREAREADCGEIRLELAAATGGGLRRGRLRYHLESCPGCAAYLQEVKRQRKLLGVALPVLPTLALRDSVMSAAGIGSGAAGAAAVGSAGGGLGAVSAGSAGAVGGAAAGGAATVGATLLGGTAVKLAVVGAILVGGAGVAAEVVHDDRPLPADSPSTVDGGTRGVGPAGVTPAGSPAARALEVRRGARGAERRGLGQQRAERRGGGRSAAGDAHGKGFGGERGKPDGSGRGKPDGSGRGKPLKAPRSGGRGTGPTTPGVPPGGARPGASGPPTGRAAPGRPQAPGADRRAAPTPPSRVPRPVTPPAAGNGVGVTGGGATGIRRPIEP
jgi:RNA polymerase sigma factor (sigma-70 family)